jgi:hypothetical protein
MVTVTGGIRVSSRRPSMVQGEVDVANIHVLTEAVEFGVKLG